MALLGKKVSELLPAEVEFLKEAASALRREGEKLEEALGVLREAEERLDAFCLPDKRNYHRSQAQGIHHTGGNPEHSTALEQYEKAWKRAEKARYTYIIHREAIGFRTHRFVDRIYPLPPFRRIRKSL